jgi:hypothetical protein
MAILDLPLEHPPSRRRRYAFRAVAFLIVGLLAFLYLWYVGYPLYPLRFHTERITTRDFLDALIAGNEQRAYQIWKPSPSYSFQDFLTDWGPSGMYGPVKSFRLERSELPPRGGTSVIVKVDVSPDQPFPGDNEAAKQSKVQEVELWVDRKDQSISFPPY